MELAIERERCKERHAEQQRVDEETRMRQQRAKDREVELNKLKQFKRDMMMAKKKEEQGGFLLYFLACFFYSFISRISFICFLDGENVVVVKGRDGATAMADMRAREVERQEVQKEREKEMEREREKRFISL